MIINFLGSCSCRVAIFHRSKLRPGRRQPSGAGGHGQPPQIHNHRKSPSLRCRSRHHQGPRQFRHRNRHRRRQRRHSESRRRSQRGHSVGERERLALLPGEQHHSHHRRKRDFDLSRPGSTVSARPGDAKCPKCPRRGLARWQDQGLDGALDGRVDSVGPAVVRVVQPGAARHAETAAGASEGQQIAVHDQPVPVLRLPERPKIRDAGVLPLPAQLGPGRLRQREALHEHVRCSGQ